VATPISQLKASAAELAARIVGAGLLVWNETTKRWHGGDGVTVGGVAMARYDERNDGALGYVQRVETDAINHVDASDSGKVIIGNRATAITFNLASAATLGAGFVAIFKNINTGAMTIVPDGVEEIDGGNAAITVPNGTSLILKGNGTHFRTYLSNVDVTGIAINGAPALIGANLADTDKLGVYDASAAGLASIVVSELVAGIFKTARKITNAYFLSSFRLWDAADATKGLAFSLTGISTATVRTITMPDADIDLGKLSLKNGGLIALSGTSIELTGIPADVQRVFLDLSVAASVAAALELTIGDSSGILTSGYSGTRSAVGASTVGSGNLLSTAITWTSSTSQHPGLFVFTRQSGNLWKVSGSCSYSAPGINLLNAMCSGLTGPLSRIKLSTGSAATLSGTAKVWWEF